MSRSAHAECKDCTKNEAVHPAPTVLLSKTGGDRGTAYVMSNKIARRGGRLICTWIDSRRQNQWAMVDPNSGKILRTGPVGEPRRDNHCGAAMTTDVDGTLHLVVGAHHGPLVHYRMPPDDDEWQVVEDGRAVGQLSTYPSLVCDGNGTLHLTYRYGKRSQPSNRMTGPS